MVILASILLPLPIYPASFLLCETRGRCNHPLGNQFVLFFLFFSCVCDLSEEQVVVSLSLKCNSPSLLLNLTNKEVLLEMREIFPSLNK